MLLIVILGDIDDKLIRTQILNKTAFYKVYLFGWLNGSFHINTSRQLLNKPYVYLRKCTYIVCSRETPTCCVLTFWETSSMFNICMTLFSLFLSLSCPKFVVIKLTLLNSVPFVTPCLHSLPARECIEYKTCIVINTNMKQNT